MNKVLILGITGYLGSELAKKLILYGYIVIGIKRKNSSINRLKSCEPQIKFCDIEDIDFKNFFQINPGIDTIINTATNYGRKDESFEEIFNSNLNIPLQLLHSATVSNIKNFINTDTTLNKYFNLYSFTKYQFFECGNFFSANYPIKFLNVKLDYFYGEKEDNERFLSYVINICITNTLELKLTSGEQKRDFVYIDDVVNAYMVLIQNIENFPTKFIEFEVGTGKPISIKDAVNFIHENTHSRTKLLYGSEPLRDKELLYSSANTSALTSLGWICRYDFFAGIKKVIIEKKNLLASFN